MEADSLLAKVVVGIAAPALMLLGGWQSLWSTVSDCLAPVDRARSGHGR